MVTPSCNNLDRSRSPCRAEITTCAATEPGLYQSRSRSQEICYSDKLPDSFLAVRHRRRRRTLLNHRGVCGGEQRRRASETEPALRRPLPQTHSYFYRKPTQEARFDTVLLSPSSQSGKGRRRKTAPPRKKKKKLSVRVV